MYILVDTGTNNTTSNYVFLHFLQEDTKPE